MDTIQTTVFAQSLSNFTCRLSMMRGGTLLIMGHGIKGQGQLWHSVYMTFWVMGSKVPRSTLALCIYDLVVMIQTIVYAQSLSNFTCKLWMMRGGNLLIWGHRVKGQCQLWHSVYKTLWTQYKLQFLPNHFQTSHVSCG